MQIAVKFRDNVVGYGSDPALFIETPEISIFHQTDIQIIIPKDRIYWAVPQGNIHITRFTVPGPHILPVPAVPYGAIDDYVVDMELIRQNAEENW